MSLTKAQIAVRTKAAIAVIQKAYKGAKNFDFDEANELTFDVPDGRFGTISDSLSLPFDEVEGFPNCCGLEILTGFDPQPGPTQQAAFFVAFHSWKLRKAAVLASTANQPGAERMLLHTGFELVHSTVNPGSQNVVKLWIYKFTHKKQR
jgi:hypothetical protein